MIADIKEQERKAMIQLEEEWIKREEERKAEWEKEEAEHLKHSVKEVEGETLDSFPEHRIWEKEHENNPLEHDPEEHLNEILGEEHHEHHEEF